jgi:hypothetical protein
MKISTIKPEEDAGKRRPIPKITWNNKTEQSLKENGFWPQPDEKGMYEQDPPHINEEEKRFLSEVDTKQGPIERVVTAIVRLKAIDYSTEKRERKEYLFWYENWYGRNWLGVKIAPVTQHVEGYYHATTKELRLDPSTGASSHYVKGKPQETYYIPYSKTTVDKIISGYYNDPKDSVRYINSRDNIHYIVKFASEDSPPGQGRYATRGRFSYEQFATWTFQDLYKLHTKPLIQQLDPNIGPTTTSYR